MLEDECRFRVQFKSNIRQHIEWLEYLVDPAFWENARERMARPARLQKLVNMARQVIHEEIYSYENYQGEGKITESAAATGTDDGLALYFDPLISGAKGPVSSGNLQEFSYAAFFEKPIEFNSFIKPRDAMTPNRYRPFMAPLEQGMQDSSEQNAMQAIRESMKIKKPRFLSV